MHQRHPPDAGTVPNGEERFDVDPVQLLQTYSGLSENGSLVGEQGIAGAGPFCLGGVASPYADPMELQVLRLDKKAGSGAQFLITQPVFDLDRFAQWWQEVTHRRVAREDGHRGRHPAVVATRRRPSSWPPVVRGRGFRRAVLERLASAGDAPAQRAAGMAIAVETIGRLAAFKGLRGFQICIDGDVDAALEVIDKAALGTN